MYPSQMILNMAASMGVPLTFGSDAHAPTEVGMNFTEAYQAARQAGFAEVLRGVAFTPGTGVDDDDHGQDHGHDRW